MPNRASDLTDHEKQLETAIAMMVKAVDAKPSTRPVPAYPANGIVKPQE